MQARCILHENGSFLRPCGDKMAVYIPRLMGLVIFVTAWIQIVVNTPIGVEIRGDVSLPASRNLIPYVRLSENAKGDVIIDIDVHSSHFTDAEGPGSLGRVTSPFHGEPVWNPVMTPPQPARVAMTTGFPAPVVLMRAPAAVPTVTSLLSARVTATSLPTSHVTKTPLPTSHMTTTPPTTSHVITTVSTTTRKAESPPLSTETPGSSAPVTEQAVRSSTAVSTSIAPTTVPVVKTTTLPPLCSHPLLSKYLTICKTG